MSKATEPQGLEPIDALDAKALPLNPRPVSRGLRVNVRGRSVNLRGMRRSPT